MAGLLETPFLWVVATIALYAVAYWGYGKWVDRNVWRSDAKKATPAHMYMDGVEYFPVSRYVLWGYQFKSVAALGPILGPFIGIAYGWIPALLWIIGGNFFIGWLQDYGSMMLSVRKEGRSFGPITYEFTGAKGRNNLLAFVLFYLIIISATFIALIAQFWNAFGGTTFVPTIGVLLSGLLCGQLLYKLKMNVMAVTVIGIGLVIVSIYLGMLIPVTMPWGAAWNTVYWAAICAVILYVAAILPVPTFIQPTNYLAFYPAYTAIMLLLLGALLSPFTGVPVAEPAFVGVWNNTIGPIWPILFVSVVAGLSPTGASVTAWVGGAQALVSPLVGGKSANAVLATFFGLVLIIYALTVQALVTRFFRLVAGETWGEGRFHILGNKHVATFFGLGVSWVFAISGSWWALWLYFGGANQLLAGLAIMLIAIYLAKTRSPTRNYVIPGVFMVVTTLAALIWETWTFVNAAIQYVVYNNAAALAQQTRPPVSGVTLAALAIDAVFVGVGVALFLVGLSMAIRLFRTYGRSKAEGRVPAPAAADGGELENKSH
ncbi:MAG: carbon starvation protein A [Methanobacteriota archaeon]|nr:MAG: carbon starvation protein A [Euryarchaeota archaeon]